MSRFVAAPAFRWTLRVNISWPSTTKLNWLGALSSSEKFPKPTRSLGAIWPSSFKSVTAILGANTSPTLRIFTSVGCGIGNEPKFGQLLRCKSLIT